MGNIDGSWLYKMKYSWFNTDAFYQLLFADESGFLPLQGGYNAPRVAVKISDVLWQTGSAHPSRTCSSSANLCGPGGESRTSAGRSHSGELQRQSNLKQNYAFFSMICRFLIRWAGHGAGLGEAAELLC